MKQLLLALFIFFSASILADEEISDKDIKRLRGALVSVHENGREGGTGAFISPKLILTANHVINSIISDSDPESLKNLKLKHDKKNLKGIQVVRAIIDSWTDIALLELNKEVKLPFYFSVGSVRDIELDPKTSIIELMHLSKSPGVSSSYKQIFNMVRESNEIVSPRKTPISFSLDNSYKLDTTIDLRPGESGSPLVYSKTGKILAINVEAMIDVKIGSSSSWASISDYALALIEEAKKLELDSPKIIRIDISQSVEEKLIKDKYPHALAEKGIRHYLEKEFNEAYPLLLKGAEAGNIRAKAYLMLYYQFQAEESKRDFAKIEKLKKEALEKLDHSTLREVGSRLIENKAYSEAFLFYKKSGESGDSVSQHHSRVFAIATKEKYLQKNQYVKETAKLISDIFKISIESEDIKEIIRQEGVNFPGTLSELHALIKYFPEIVTYKGKKMFKMIELVLEHFELYTDKDFKEARDKITLSLQIKEKSSAEQIKKIARDCIEALQYD